MKNLFFLCVVLCFTGIGYCQEYTAFDGTVFSTGDTVTVGYNSGYNHYQYIAEYGTSYDRATTNLTLKKYAIKSVNETYSKVAAVFYDRAQRIITFGKKGILGVSYYADINEALRSGEIVVKDNPNALQFDALADSVAFAYFVKELKEPVKQFREEYLQRYFPKIYSSNRNDEFEFQKSLAKGEKGLVQGIEHHNFSQPYRLLTRLNLESYDFEKGGFPLQEENLRLNVVIPGYRLDHAGPYPATDIVFPNFSAFRFVQVDENEANGLLKRRKDRYGSVNREVYATINFELDGLYPKQTENTRLLQGNILSIELYEFSNYRYNWIGTIEMPQE